MANKVKTIASVHRFCESVALYVGNGETAYITPKEARQLARALNRCAWSVDNETFVNSQFGTTDITRKE